MSNLMRVYYGTDCLPYKDKERTVHYPIVGNSFLGSNNVTRVRFFIDRIGNYSDTWVANTKLPNDKLGNELLTTKNEEDGEHYVELALGSFYTQAKGDLYISLNAFYGDMTIESSDGQYQINGNPYIQATGPVKIPVYYATPLISGEQVDEITLEKIYAEFGNKLDIDDPIYIRVVANINQINTPTYEKFLKDGDVVFDVHTGSYYQISGSYPTLTSEEIELDYYNKQQTDTLLSQKIGIADRSVLVEELPETGESNVFYVVQSENDGNLYTVYIWNLQAQDYIWVGNTSLDLGNYYTKTEGETFEQSVIADISQYKNYIDSEVESLSSGSPKGVYSTLADLQSAYPTGTTGIYVVSSTGHWYYWNGMEWTDGGTYQAVEIANNSIDYNKIKLDFIKHSKNLFNKELADNSTDDITYNDFIYLKAGTYCFSINGGYFMYGSDNALYIRGKFYNLNKVADTSIHANLNKNISAYASGNWYETFTITQDCYFKPNVYCGTSGNPSPLPYNRVMILDYIQIEEGLTPTLYEPYYDEFSYQKDIEPKASDILLRTKNLFDKAHIKDGIVSQLFRIRNDASYGDSWTSTKPIPIENGKTYTLSTTNSGTSLYCIILDSSCMVNSNSQYRGIENGKYTFTATFDGYVFITGQARQQYLETTDVSPDMVQFEESADKTDYVPYYQANEEYFENGDNQFKNKSLYVFGDSIMAASTDGVDGVGELLRDKYGMILSNYAIDGRLITVRDTSYRNDTIIYEVENASANIPNYVIWNGGTNDLSSWDTLPHGTISTGFQAELDETTFCGAFEKTIKTLMTKYPGARIIFCTTHVNGGRSGTPPESALPDQVEIWDLCRQMCHKWGIPVADIYWDSGLNSFLSQYKGVFTDAGGTHPNTLGYKIFYLPVVEHKM